MTDVHTKAQRSRNMAAIKSGNTKPEIRVRSILHSLGYRYRLHRKDLPGKPDIVLPKYHTVIFVHGCFWHCHDCKWGKVTPKTRAKFWRDKRAGNVTRDKKHRVELQALGWRVVTIWECEARSTDALRKLLISHTSHFSKHRQVEKLVTEKLVTDGTFPSFQVRGWSIG